MTLVIGVDEAGYGPNLGPLAIGLSAWDVDEKGRGAPNLYQLLERAVTDKYDGERVAVADSKLLYKPGSGLGNLELGVLAMLSMVSDISPLCWSELLHALQADADRRPEHLDWHRGNSDPELPVDATPIELRTAGDLLLRATPREVTLCAMRARLVFPEEFNAGCGKHASKGLALSHWTLGLLSGAIRELLCSSSPDPPAPICVTCDKHGGRNRYAGLLCEHFPEYNLRVIVESRPRSAYVLDCGECRIQIEFRTKGESRMETALASMVAKYLRELSMRAFNAFWRVHLPHIKPTAGYPVDAKRFKRDIERKQQELGIDDAILWRER